MCYSLVVAGPQELQNHVQPSACKVVVFWEVRVAAWHCPVLLLKLLIIFPFDAAPNGWFVKNLAKLLFFYYIAAHSDYFSEPLFMVRRKHIFSTLPFFFGILWKAINSCYVISC